MLWSRGRPDIGRTTYLPARTAGGDQARRPSTDVLDSHPFRRVSLVPACEITAVIWGNVSMDEATEPSLCGVIGFPGSLEMALAEAGDEIESGSISRLEDMRRPPEWHFPYHRLYYPRNRICGLRRDSQESGLAFQQPRRPECWSWSTSRLGPGGVTNRGRKIPAKRAGFMAAGPGFEPGLSDSESLVLPLHHPAKYSGAYCNARSGLRRGVFRRRFRGCRRSPSRGGVLFSPLWADGWRRGPSRASRSSLRG